MCLSIVIYLYSQHVKCTALCLDVAESTTSIREHDPVTVHRETVHRSNFLDKGLALDLVQISWAGGPEIQIDEIVLFVSHRIIHDECVLPGDCDKHGSRSNRDTAFESDEQFTDERFFLSSVLSLYYVDRTVFGNGDR